MPIILLLVFLSIPIIEITIFIQAGEVFGLWPTISFVVLTAILGTFFLRQQGLQTLFRVQTSLEQGEIPVGELFAGVCLLVAGLLLLTPGFFTDAVGFTLFVPIVRNILAGSILQMLSQPGTIGVNTGYQASPEENEGIDGTVINGDFTEIKDEPTKSSGMPITIRKDGEPE